MVPSLLICGGQDDGALSIRKDRSPVVLRKLAKGESEARVSRRLLGDRQCARWHEPSAARSAGMDRQTLRDWIIRYAYGLDGLADQRGDGRPPKLSPEEKGELVADRSRRPGSGGKRHLSFYARRPGADLQGAVRQEPACDVDGSHPARVGAVVAKGETQPPAKRPCRAGGL